MCALSGQRAASREVRSRPGGVCPYRGWRKRARVCALEPPTATWATPRSRCRRSPVARRAVAMTLAPTRGVAGRPWPRHRPPRLGMASLPCRRGVACRVSKPADGEPYGSVETAHGFRTVYRAADRPLHDRRRNARLWTCEWARARHSLGSSRRHAGEGAPPNHVGPSVTSAAPSARQRSTARSRDRPPATATTSHRSDCSLSRMGQLREWLLLFRRGAALPSRPPNELAHQRRGPRFSS